LKRRDGETGRELTRNRAGDLRRRNVSHERRNVDAEEMPLPSWSDAITQPIRASVERWIGAGSTLVRKSAVAATEMATAGCVRQSINASIKSEQIRRALPKSEVALSEREKSAVESATLDFACGCSTLALPLAWPYVPSRRERRAKLVGGPQMTWKTPKIVEVPVGMEINMYACAARK
jgi:coenzyme PQQ precursor peptide PqqA